MNIRELAKLAGVSVSTVSKALNDNYQDISDETRQYVRAMAQAHNYHPNQLASAMVRRRTGNIALIIPNISSPFFPVVAKGVTDYAYSMGINTIICNTENDVNRENKHLSSLTQGMVDGIIVTPTDERTEGYDGVVPDNLPLVLIGCSIWMERRYTTVRTDSELGAYLAINHLLELGHRDILFVGGSPNSVIAQLRMDGYVRAFEEHNVPLNPRLIYQRRFLNEPDCWAIEDALQQKVSFTAVFCVNDLIAYAALRTLKASGLRVPQDVSVVGFDDLPLTSEYLGLTSVSQPKYRMGHDAARTLCTLIEGGAAQNQLLLPVLTKRESTAPPQ